MSRRYMANSLAPSEDFFSVPIFIQNFNRLSCLKNLIQWCLSAGYKNIIIIDNGSTYAPLISFYREITSSASVEVVSLPRDTSRFGLWEHRLLDRFKITGPFVYTDSDIVPDERCPQDVVKRLASILHNNPDIFKAGLGLRLDDLPSAYQFRKEVIAWERQFWRAPVARGIFRAKVDTTFALYRPRSEFSINGIRTGWPYLATHESWYENLANPSEEVGNYLNTAWRGHWLRPELPTHLREAVSLRTSVPEPVLLHLSCGHERIPGWINLDKNDKVDPDVLFDLELCGQKCMPLEDNSVDGFFMCRGFGHIQNTLSMMEELYRVAKPVARFIIRIPQEASDESFEKLTGSKPLFPNSFLYFAQPAYSRAGYSYFGDWEVKRIKFVVNPGHELHEEMPDLEQINSERNIFQEVIIELLAAKPVKAREFRLLEWPLPTFSHSPIDDESVF